MVARIAGFTTADPENREELKQGTANREEGTALPS
jgi:hypothetical protein